MKIVYTIIKSNLYWKKSVCFFCEKNRAGEIVNYTTALYLLGGVHSLKNIVYLYVEEYFDAVQSH